MITKPEEAKKDYYRLGKVEYNRQYRLKNLEKLKQRDKDRYEANKEEIKAKHKISSKIYYQNHKEEIGEQTKAWREQHPESVKLSKQKWSKNNREFEKAKTIAWQKANPEKMKAIRVRSENKRRATKRNVLVSITLQEMDELIQNSKNICFWCDKDIPEGQMHLDHIYPLSKGGGHTISNIVVSCADCNMKKHNKDPEIWLYEVLNDNKA